MDALPEEVVGVDALGAADDFAVALGGEDVDAEGLGGVVGVGLHVEGLEGGGVAVDHDGAVELGAEVGLVGRAEVVAVDVGGFELAFFVGGRAWRGPGRRRGGESMRAADASGGKAQSAVAELWFRCFDSAPCASLRMTDSFPLPTSDGETV